MIDRSCVCVIVKSLLWLYIPFSVITSYASAQGLPDPMATAADPHAVATSTTINNATIGKISPNLLVPDPEIARRMESRVLLALESLGNQVEEAHVTEANLSRKSDDLGTRRVQLQYERNRVMADYREGFFCSTCGRARSEFPSPDAFVMHIREGASEGRHIVAATAVQLRAKDAEFDAKFLALENQMGQIQQQISRQQKLAKSAYEQMQDGIDLWRTAITFEKRSLEMQQEVDQHQLGRDEKEASKHITDLDSIFKREMKKNDPDPETLNSIASNRKMWSAMLQSTQEQSGVSALSYRQQILAADTRVQEQYNRLNASVAKASPYLLSMRNQLQFIPTLNVSIQEVSFYTSPSALGASFQFGKVLSGGLALSSSETSQDATAFIDLFGKVRLQVGWQSKMDAYGNATSGSTQSLGLAPKSPGPKIKIKSIRVEERPTN